MAAITISLQLLVLLFHQITTLFDLYPFNNVREYTIKERIAEGLINGSIMVVPVIGFWWHVQWMMTASLVIYPVLLLGEYLNCWRPYFFGATEAWQKTYDRLFRKTIIVLPPIKHHPIPNLEHTLLYALTVMAAIVTYIYYFTPL
jgi:hypothetical protein